MVGKQPSDIPASIGSRRRTLLPLPDIDGAAPGMSVGMSAGKAIGAGPDSAGAAELAGQAGARLTVVAIGASAGGLDACQKLLDAMAVPSGMCFILVQHLDPTHDSLLVELLATHTAMTVLQATDGMLLQADHLYVIPPGTYLSLGAGALHLSKRDARHGARLPFDFLLQTLATEYGADGCCVILSGTGADGSLGLREVKAHDGFVIAQDPDEAGYDGMPRSAIMTGAVDQVLSVAAIPAALMQHVGGGHTHPAISGVVQSVIDLLRRNTPHDFSLYKLGTLQRRISRRMAMDGFGPENAEGYLAALQNSTPAMTLLAKDLLINVTAFFRDAAVFDMLAAHTIPDLVARHRADAPIRVWIAACSTGEEAYSLAMLFREQVTAVGRTMKLQLFASDIDADAVATAREGLYPESIAADVSAARLSRFFTHEDSGYRVSAELRASVVFTVHDVLVDPPFSRLDFVSCRNLLIYLQPEAQASIISRFHFALREGGILLLGGSETIGAEDRRFAVIAKPERIYRHVGREPMGDVGFGAPAGERSRLLVPQPGARMSRHAALGELCRRLVLQYYAPAAVLIDQMHDVLFSLGPTDRYLHIAPGHPTHDLLSMARGGLRARLEAAIQQAGREKARALVPHRGDEHADSCDIIVQPVTNDGESLMLVCFVETTASGAVDIGSPGSAAQSDSDGLRGELESVRAELQAALRNLEITSGDQKALNEEALSIQEEYQSTNEELLTSKEELQSLNEELTALNGQLQESLERQRTTATDLQNILYSTDVATLFLDTKLNIRFFTPATRALFNVIPGDIGRPLADLRSLASDDALLPDARGVLLSHAVVQRTVTARNGEWYNRRILPYRAQNDAVEGVVITFANVTDRIEAGGALENARKLAEQATVAKSRFLAAASHDLRQPLQTLILLHDLLSKMPSAERSAQLLVRLNDTLDAMTGMLNTLLDINQIEAGTVDTVITDFAVNDLLAHLQQGFGDQALAQGLQLRVLPCAAVVRTDPQLLEQILRNLVANALKYTRKGRVLIGCRRHGGVLRIEVWDSGIGIPEAELTAIFEEYHQLDNAARERSRGLGLGLSIVQRLADLFGHRVAVSSRLGKGSRFSIELPLVGAGLHPPGLAGTSNGLTTAPPLSHVDTAIKGAAGGGLHHGGGLAPSSGRCGSILIIEDDPDVGSLLALCLTELGHRVSSAGDGAGALAVLAGGDLRPDVILADYNLPGGMTGIDVVVRVRAQQGRAIPAVILTGDISASTLQTIESHHFVHLDKPVKLAELAAIIERLLAPAESAAVLSNLDRNIIFVVDDDPNVRAAIREVLEGDGQDVADYASCEAFLAAYTPRPNACLLLDAYLPGMSGLELMRHLSDSHQSLPAIMITGSSDVSVAVRAMKAGATDFIEKPFGAAELIASVQHALALSHDAGMADAIRLDAQRRIGELTPRQREIMAMVLLGNPSKNIAADLGISQRTVENHRAEMMRRTGTKSLPALARLALAAQQG